MIKFKLSVCDGDFLTGWRGLLVLFAPTLLPYLPLWRLYATEVVEFIDDGCLRAAEWDEDTGLECTNVQR